jgi:hypothetical protein
VPRGRTHYKINQPPPRQYFSPGPKEQWLLLPPTPQLPGNQSCPAALLSPRQGNRRTSCALREPRAVCCNLLPRSSELGTPPPILRGSGKRMWDLGFRDRYPSPFLSSQWWIRPMETRKGKKKKISTQPECKGRSALFPSEGMRWAGGRKQGARVVRPAAALQGCETEQEAPSSPKSSWPAHSFLQTRARPSLPTPKSLILELRGRGISPKPRRAQRL